MTYEITVVRKERQIYRVEARTPQEAKSIVYATLDAEIGREPDRVEVVEEYVQGARRIEAA